MASESQVGANTIIRITWLDSWKATTESQKPGIGRSIFRLGVVQPLNQLHISKSRVKTGLVE